MSRPGSSPGALRTEARYSLVELASRLSDVISLGRGDPDLDTPRPVLEEALRLVEGPVERPPLRGLERLRSAIAERYHREKGLAIDPAREVLITNGAQEALFLALLAVVDPGDGVMVTDPRYSSYDQAVEAARGRLVLVPTERDQDFVPDQAEVRERADRAKVLVLVNPCNPTGALAPPGRVRAIAEVARRTGLLVVSDEIYEGLVYDGLNVLSVATCDGMRARTITLSGFSKTYAMTGFRVGYLVGPPGFIEAAVRLKGAISGPGPLLPQCTALAALESPQDSVAEFRRIFEGRRRLMMRGLDDLDIPYGHPGGGFFMWADVSRFGVPATEFCHRLLQEGRVLMFPGTSFGSRWEYYVRISLLQPEGRLTEALSRLRRFVEGLT